MDVETDFPYRHSTLGISDRIDDLLGRMTLAEKIGQMTQPEKNSITPEDVTAYGIGSVLSGGGGNPSPNTPSAWAEMVDSLLEAGTKTRLGIPLIYGVDAVHGHNNVKGAVIFPHNIGLGASQDEALIERVNHITAVETIATGCHWTFAPTIAVPRDIRWGRTYEGFSEDTTLTSRLGAAAIRGLQNHNGTRTLSHPRTILATPKHYVGDGGTSWGTAENYDWIAAQWEEAAFQHGYVDQGVTTVEEEVLRSIHLPPYAAAIEAGALCIMVSYSSWGGQKMHAHRYLLTDVLKDEMGFAGFLVTDWMAIDQIDPDHYTSIVAAVNAGIDMIMVPFDYKRSISNLTRAVEQGDVALARIDDAVRRILRAKFELGLFETPLRDQTLLQTVGSDEHRQVAREAVQKSLVLLKNEQAVLPLAKDTSLIYLAGQAGDDIGLQCGGWTIEWGGAEGPITEGTTLLQALNSTLSESAEVYYEANGVFEADAPIADVGVVVLSEPPYAEGMGDRQDLGFSDVERKLLSEMRHRCEKLVLILFSGRPLIITDVLPLCDAVVAAWLPGTEGQGVIDVLFGDAPFSAKLPYAWPRSMDQVPYQALADSSEDPLFPFGYGLMT